ncbi:MAG: response regulator transcription factor [Anaerolineales bacterium]|nr:response regulator transcription factor [Anaerolineales bacterium]
MLRNTASDDIQIILVVDDSPYIVQAVEHTLRPAGFEVRTALSGEDALANINRYGLPHLALIDLNMPGIDGFQLCEAIHEFSDLPIVMLTAIDDEATVVHGLDNFAEDYIVKPFRAAELVARVKRVLRRMGDFAYRLDPIVHIDDDLQVDFPNRQAVIRQETVQLTPTETKLLYILIRNAGRTVTNNFLLRRVWPEDDAFEDRLHTHIYRLRRKIEKSPKEPYYIISDWGTGYTFINDTKDK